MLSARNFRGTRLAVALALLARSLTASEVAQSLGKPTGSIFGVLKRMTEDGILVIDTASPVRGTRYSLLPEARSVVGEIEHAAGTGRVGPAEKLLLVEQPTKMGKAQALLAEDWVAGLVLWAAEVAGGWLLALEVENSFAVQKLAIALEGAGAETRSLSVGDVLSGTELQSRALWHLEDVTESR